MRYAILLAPLMLVVLADVSNAAESSAGQSSAGKERPFLLSSNPDAKVSIELKDVETFKAPVHREGNLLKFDKLFIPIGTAEQKPAARLHPRRGAGSA